MPTTRMNNRKVAAASNDSLLGKRSAPVTKSASKRDNKKGSLSKDKQEDDEAEDEELAAARTPKAKELIIQLRAHAQTDGYPTYRQTLLSLKNFIASEQSQSHKRVFASRFMDKFREDHAGKLLNPKLNKLLHNFECMEYKMQHMDSELSTEKIVIFDWNPPNSEVHLEIKLYLVFSGYTDGEGRHHCSLSVNRPGTSIRKRFANRSDTYELDDYEEYDDLFTTNMRKADIRQFQDYWLEAHFLRETLISAPFVLSAEGVVKEGDDVADDDADDDARSDVPAVDAEKLSSKARTEFLDFLNHVICTMKHTHPYDSDDD